MSDKRISIDDLLTEQSHSGLLATVEAIEGKPEFIKVTPWSAVGGCSCHRAIQIKKSSVEGVTPTGDTHFCCGKRHKVVELHFKKGETIPLENLFQQLSEAATNLVHHSHQSADFDAHDLDFQAMYGQVNRGRRATHRELGALNPRFGNCWPKYASCISSINPFSDNRSQLCECRNELKICLGEGILELCPSPRY